MFPNSAGCPKEKNTVHAKRNEAVLCKLAERTGLSGQKIAEKTERYCAKGAEGVAEGHVPTNS